jgi:hypothetical protein
MINADRLFRFNVIHGLAGVGLAEHQAVDKIEAHTATYLKKFDTARDVEQCAISLKETGQRLGYIAGEGKTLLSVTVFGCFCLGAVQCMLTLDIWQSYPPIDKFNKSPL